LKHRVSREQLKGVRLGKARLLRGDVAPLLDDRLLDLPGVGLGPGAHLLGDINALFSRGKLGDQLGDMGAGSLGLQRALLSGLVLDNGLGLVLADLSSLFESTTSGSAELTGLLGTSGDGSVLLDLLLLNRADLSGPLGALGLGGVAGGLILALLILDSLTGDNIILNIMLLLLGPALRLILGSADLRSLDITVLDKGGSAHLDGLVEGNLLVADEAVLPEVLLALLLLLGLIVGHKGGVAPPVVGVVTLDGLIILGLLDHLDLVNALLTIRSRTGSSNGSKADVGVIRALVHRPGVQLLGDDPGGRGSLGAALKRGGLS